MQKLKETLLSKDKSYTVEQNLNLIWFTVLILGSVEFIALPVVYVLGKYAEASVANMLIIASYIFVSLGKAFALWVFSGFPPQNKWRVAYESAILAREKVFGFSLCWPKGITIFLTTITCYCETLTVVLAVATAGNDWNDEEQKWWSHGWAHTPFGILSFVGWFRLPTLLGCIVALGTLLHLVVFYACMFKLGLFDNPDFGHGVGAEQISIASGTGNLLLIQAVAKIVGADGESQTFAQFTAALSRVVIKLVLGTGLRLWFKVSLFSIVWRSNLPEAFQPTLIAAILSFVHAAQLIYQFSQYFFLPEVYSGFNRTFDSTTLKAGIFGIAILLLFPVWGSFIRFMGAFMCPTHMFNLSVAACVP